MTKGYKLTPGQRVRVRGVPGVFSLRQILMRPEGPRAAIEDGTSTIREVPLHILRPARYGRRRGKLNKRR